jgi:hypothetical protein
MRRQVGAGFQLQKRQIKNKLSKFDKKNLMQK